MPNHLFIYLFIFLWASASIRSMLYTSGRGLPLIELVSMLFREKGERPLLLYLCRDYPPRKGKPDPLREPRYDPVLYKKAL